MVVEASVATGVPRSHCPAAVLVQVPHLGLVIDFMDSALSAFMLPCSMMESSQAPGWVPGTFKAGKEDRDLAGV